MCNFGNEPDLTAYMAALNATPTGAPPIIAPPPPVQAAMSVDLAGIYNANKPKAETTQLTAIGGVNKNSLALEYKSLLG